ncbi:ATP-binding protein [Siccirubricoccus deserti]|uniref:ATP-binding protein Uup n=1 Tax=Siccirubricoccus deserti TaxID=2013562 RepID=A0A9X0UBD0_9PROT|nr:ABC-F family ATP-binding cassette domain-containing protein [Siccirubricoccus deserti]MBC4013827.1 ABC-F family ATP-binding cassette domain-containing protein [Siccirubricoccus deserti]GGC29813.1 ATP-binding protein [Siccirubricoccus deserti]
MAPPLLLLQDIHLHLGTTPLLTGATLSVGPGERLALVGRNGSGKSTLLKVAAGVLQPEAGTRFLQPGATLRSLPQEPDFGGARTVWEHVEAGLGPGDDPYRARWLLEQLGLTGEEAPGRLSGGEARRAALARALAPAPDILLLDEPTNHLDLPAIAWLEAELASMRGALVLISHDRRFLETLSRAMVWLDRGTTRRLEKGFAGFEAWRDQVLEEEEREAHKLDRKIVREEHWMRYGVTARRKRNMRRVGELAALRQRRRDALKATGTVRMAASEGEGSGTLVAQAEAVTKGYDGAAPVVRDFSTRILRRDRVGIVGPNGAGKTTLLKLLTGELQPDSGTVRLGTGLQMVTLDQSRDSLDPALSLAEALTGGSGDQVEVGGQRRHVVGYMKDFLFVPDQARTAVGVLSGGERGRLMLARALARPSNLLVLDEPTNDLDLETLDLLEELLAEYAGTVLVVSHDRDFLDRVCTSVIVSEGDGRWQEYAGGYTDMLAQRGRGVEAKPAAAPERAAAKPAAAPAPAPAAKRKLTFKQQHALQTLPGRMEALQAEIAQLRTVLAAPGLYTRDRARFERFTAALTEKEAALAAAEEEWLELEMLREEIEAG